jgi:hypothetical protein
VRWEHEKQDNLPAEAKLRLTEFERSLEQRRPIMKKLGKAVVWVLGAIVSLA